MLEKKNLSYFSYLITFLYFQGCEGCIEDGRARASNYRENVIIKSLQTLDDHIKTLANDHVGVSNDLTNKVDDLYNKIDNIDPNKNFLITKVSNLLGALSDLNTKIDNNQQYLLTELKTLNTNFTDLNQDVDKLNGNIDALIQNILKFNINVNKLNNNIDDLNKKIDSLFSNIIKVRSDIDNCLFEFDLKVLLLTEKNKKNFKEYHPNLFTKDLLAKNAILVLHIVLGFESYASLLENQSLSTKNTILKPEVDKQSSSSCFSFTFLNVHDDIFTKVWKFCLQQQTKSFNALKQICSDDIIYYVDDSLSSDKIKIVNPDELFSNKYVKDNKIETFYIRNINFSGILKFFINKESEIACEFLEPDNYAKLII